MYRNPYNMTNLCPRSKLQTAQATVLAALRVKDAYDAKRRQNMRKASKTANWTKLRKKNESFFLFEKIFTS